MLYVEKPQMSSFHPLTFRIMLVMSRKQIQSWVKGFLRSLDIWAEVVWDDSFRGAVKLKSLYGQYEGIAKRKKQSQDLYPIWYSILSM